MQPVDGGFRARVRLSINGSCKLCPGPRRPDEEAAKEDLESMRAAANGMGREEGFAAMKFEADELKAGKPPEEIGYIHRDGNVFRAHVEIREATYPRALAARRGGRQGRSSVFARRSPRHEP